MHKKLLTTRSKINLSLFALDRPIRYGPSKKILITRPSQKQDGNNALAKSQEFLVYENKTEHNELMTPSVK